MRTLFNVHEPTARDLYMYVVQAKISKLFKAIAEVFSIWIKNSTNFKTIRYEFCLFELHLLKINTV